MKSQAADKLPNLTVIKLRKTSGSDLFALVTLESTPIVVDVEFIESAPFFGDGEDAADHDDVMALAPNAPGTAPIVGSLRPEPFPPLLLPLRPEPYPAPSALSEK